MHICDCCTGLTGMSVLPAAVRASTGADKSRLPKDICIICVRSSVALAAWAVQLAGATDSAALSINRAASAGHDLQKVGMVEYIVRGCLEQQEGRAMEERVVGQY